ncbi:MAG: RluA family pseudouridine synthase [Patescibacteria group bacterium]|jgi:23S rRNA pseudouridine1911/1915/1917 synthase
MIQRQIVVDLSEEGNRLDKFLSDQFSDYSRSFLQTQIKNGSITLNNKKSDPGIKIKAGDKIQMTLREPEKLSIKPENNIQLDILFEDKDFLVINKQSGIVVHPSESTPTHTIVNALIAYYPNISTVGDDPKRPGIVHRLDKDVSGVMVIAKNQGAFEFLKLQFQDRKIRKKYTTLVYGKMNPPNGMISAPIGRSTSQPNRMSVKKIGEGKEAITLYKTIKNYHNYSLLEIETKTGRTHQIRVHLLSRGNPIVGDNKYFLKRVTKKAELGRIFLHANSIQFTGLNGQILRFKADIPTDLKLFLKQLT